MSSEITPDVVNTSMRSIDESLSTVDDESSRRVSTYEVGESSKTTMSTSEELAIRVNEQNIEARDEQNIEARDEQNRETGDEQNRGPGVNEMREGNRLNQGNLINTQQQRQQPPQPEHQDDIPIVNPARDGVINPENWWYFLWTLFMFILALLSSIFYPLFYGFFSDFSERLIRIVSVLDGIICFLFLVDCVFQFFVSYRDTQTGRMVIRRRHIALRYMMSYFIFGLLSFIPWEFFSTSHKRSMIVIYVSWSRVARVAKVIKCLHMMQDNRRINKKFSIVVKVIVIGFLYTHVAACMIYFLATTVPLEKDGYTWIGSLKTGDYDYSDFMHMDLAKRYVTSLYFITVTLTTVGFGDIHAVGAREMIFVIIFVSFNLYVGAYLSSNISALMDIRSNGGQVSDRRTSQYRSGSDNTCSRKCNVFYRLPLNINRIQGHTMWIPRTMKELIEEAARRANLAETGSYYIVSEVGAKISKVDMIDNGQNLFLVANPPR